MAMTRSETDCLFLESSSADRPARAAVSRLNYGPRTRTTCHSPFTVSDSLASQLFARSITVTFV